MRISEQIFPRVVALIVSIDENGKENVMTASFLMPISFEPKYIAFAVAEERLTFENLKKTKEFTLNICSKEMKEKAIICGSYSGREKDKFELAKLEKEESKIVKPSLIKESPISFECKVEFMEKFGDHWLVVGKVVEEHVKNREFSPLLHKSKNIFKFLNIDSNCGNGETYEKRAKSNGSHCAFNRLYDSSGSYSLNMVHDFY